MGKNTVFYVLGGLVVLWFVFLRRRTQVTGGANFGIATGNNATPYTGLPPGYRPPASGIGYGGYGPMAPPPVIVQQGAQGDTTGGILTGVGNLLGGLGSAAGNVLGGLGVSGLLGGNSSGSSGGYSTPYDGTVGSGDGGVSADVVN